MTRLLTLSHTCTPILYHQDKEAAWREQVRAKAAAVQAQQKQGGTHKRPPAPSKKG